MGDHQREQLLEATQEEVEKAIAELEEDDEMTDRS